MASQIELQVTPVPAVDLARQYVETWVLQAEGQEGEHRSQEGVRRRWLVWAHPRQLTPFVHFLGVFDFQTEADSVSETIWLELQETPLKADVCVGVAAVYAGEQAKRFIRSWIEQIEGLVLGMKSWVDSLRTRSIEEMERRLPRPTGWREANPPCPQCESEITVPILWGYPSPETMEEIEQSVQQGTELPFAVGGCVVDPDSPVWHCSECGHQWGHFDIA
jgi:hypothetical protein